MAALNNETLKLSRNFLGLSQKNFADKLGVSQALVSNIEKSTKPLSDDIVNALKLKFGENFFSQSMYDSDLFLLYRASSRVAKKFTSLFESRLQIIANNISLLLDSLEIPQNKIPQWDLRNFNLDSEILARQVRTYFKLGNSPITDMVTFLERNGVIVIFYEYDFISAQNKSFDGVSFYVKGTPIILVNSRIQNARKVFTLAHELLHLICHNSDDFYISKERDLEKEANMFASEFIVPRHLIEREYRDLDLFKLFELKRFWKLSIGALLYKGKDNYLTYDQYRRWVTRLSKYRKKEPNDFDLNKPKLLTLMFSTFKEELGGDDELYQELGLSEEIFNEVYGSLLTSNKSKLKIAF